jgi:hypothetical protein
MIGNETRANVDMSSGRAGNRVLNEVDEEDERREKNGWALHKVVV